MNGHMGHSAKPAFNASHAALSDPSHAATRALRERLLCPMCSSRLSDARWSEDATVCLGCQRRYRRYGDVLDLRLEPHSSCWTDTLVCEERELVAAMLRGERPLSELIHVYGSAHRPLPNGAQDDIGYMTGAERRERWTVQFMLNAIDRYAPGNATDLALDAGCGSGGSLGWLAERYSVVGGIDPDLPALLIAARRCRDAGISDRVLLVAATLEQRVFEPETFDAIKCTDVIEHVKSPTQSASRMSEMLRPAGTAYVLTPNKWNLVAREPHVKLWGIQLLPRAWADRYSRWRIGITYSTVACLLSSRQMAKVLETRLGSVVRFVPIEDKHLNPRSRRGRFLKSWFNRGPLRWLSRAVRPVQPVLEAMLIRDMPSSPPG